MTDDVFAPAEHIADAVMYEGYILYPYRASAMKNRFRWQFGVLAPRACSEINGEDSWYAQTDCLIEPGTSSRVTVKARCLHLQRRLVEMATADGWRACDRVVANGRDYLTWDEAVPASVLSSSIPLDALCAHEHVVPFTLSPSLEHEAINSHADHALVRITRQRWPASAAVRLSAVRLDGMVKVRARLENQTPGDLDRGDRTSGLRHCLLGSHLLLHIEGGQFVSLTDPPPHAEGPARSCVNQHAWPVLVGANGRRDVVLASPIILPDYPAVAPESAHSFFDATEIDEMLALRVMTMTPDERAEAAATDRHAAEILDRVNCHDAVSLSQLHGAVRSFEELLNGGAPPDQAFVDVGSTRLMAGSRVRLTPHKRSDSIDIFLDGRTATVAMVHRDLDDRVHIAVTLDDDPGADLKRAYGRFFYFAPDEVHPLDAEVTDA
jgi:hypothetical protein